MRLLSQDDQQDEPAPRRLSSSVQLVITRVWRQRIVVCKKPSFVQMWLL